jgi:Heparinase II/III-like protein/Heparinase II/III N-terminus
LNDSRLDWYLRRLRRMSAGEMVWRVHDAAWKKAWTHRQVHPGHAFSLPACAAGRSLATFPPGSERLVGECAARELVRQADSILAGRLTLLGVERSDLDAPDWFFDPVTQRHAPRDEYAFSIQHRSEEVTGNVKQVWELSRLQHLTLLAAAWFVARDEAYALAVAAQLDSWWRENTFLSGVHWTSGIELGLRLISFAWIRRLLDGWDGVEDLFERSDLAVAQIWWHQEYLSRFRSRGSSANNHVIAEASGQLIGSLAFPWFESSEHWRLEAQRLLERELVSNTFPSGLNREQASDYHRFVTELGLLAAVEADASGHPLGDETWELLARSLDAAAAVVDVELRPPRQGDGDDGRALLLDPPSSEDWSTFLSAGSALVGPAAWWPESPERVIGALLAALCPERCPVQRRSTASVCAGFRPSHFSDAGLTLLRSEPEAVPTSEPEAVPTSEPEAVPTSEPEAPGPEIWCRCDGGPHGFLSIAGHAHADALSVEVRHGGVDILADPGTYCYHGQPEFRRYFRSTLAHNTIEVASVDQSTSGGPFLWERHASTGAVEVVFGPHAAVRRWSAEHDGYATLDPPVRHRRTVEFHAERRRLDICDLLTTSGSHPARIAFHLGPQVTCELRDGGADLRWRSREDEEWSAVLSLPAGPEWSAHRGERDPVLGWYSSSFGALEPTTVLVGEFRCAPGTNALSSSLTFSDARVGVGRTGRPGRVRPSGRKVA